jgi:aminoacrylate peracid reductase
MGNPIFSTVTDGECWPSRYTFSPAFRSGNLLFISGTTATDENNRIVGRGDIVAQTRFIFQKFERILAAVGATFDHIVETTDYIVTTEGYKGTADVRREFFKNGFPAATGVIVAGLLAEGALIEISAVAVLPTGLR